MIKKIVVRCLKIKYLASCYEFLLQLQHVTWNEFLPRVLGWNAVNLYELGLETDGFYDGYDEKCNPTIMNEFAAAAFRFGHSLLKPAFAQVNQNVIQFLNHG